MRSSHPVRILKWVRTDNVAKFESPDYEETENIERIPEPESLSATTVPAYDTPPNSMPEEFENDQTV